MTTYIIFDLEWVATFAKGQIPEVISIGAVKLDRQMNECDQFASYVRPKRARMLNKRTTRMTKIRPEDVQSQDNFAKVWKRFLQWIGEEEYFLLTWGPTDIHTLLQNCKLHHVSLEWLRNYNDLQAEFGRLQSLKNQSGLMEALEALHLKPIGAHHSAVDDARNTAQIFKALYDRLQLKRNNHVGLLKAFAPKQTRRPSRPLETAVRTRRGKAQDRIGEATRACRQP
ncbi:3'-5' exonuclease [Tumebacillus permanentifrigoris]|uniref:Inhibitor of KinA sporulation pathway (Predicted exonuclease) n=1 Tax=Tumebacillus permanentifrigoris TaxID=378543 RepID=A0A316D2E0_9BACL|nr:3'-5' exonuclease [Tumebacillus permanentifrigoris]PWK04938.1 inhibitor of KinA sporulation pathway (predicted exonuclease) [Tumebacillus permanentifrigoris]